MWDMIATVATAGSEATLFAGFLIMLITLCAVVLYRTTR